MSRDGHCMIIHFNKSNLSHSGDYGIKVHVCPTRICNGNIDLIVSIFFQAVKLICG